MALQEPESMAECVYFTNRSIGDGSAIAWVPKEKCPKCKKAFMGKPKDEKTGRPKIRAKEYVCPECNHTIEAKEYEETLTMNVKYVCPKCKNKGEIQVPIFEPPNVSLIVRLKGSGGLRGYVYTTSLTIPNGFSYGNQNAYIKQTDPNKDRSRNIPINLDNSEFKEYLKNLNISQ